VHFQEYFAADLPAEQAAFMARSQVLNLLTISRQPSPQLHGEVTELMLVATKDRTINPDLERWYASTSQEPHVEVTGASHAVYASRPKEVAALIEEAASQLALEILVNLDARIFITVENTLIHGETILQRSDAAIKGNIQTCRIPSIPQKSLQPEAVTGQSTARTACSILSWPPPNARG